MLLFKSNQRYQLCQIFLFIVNQDYSPIGLVQTPIELSLCRGWLCKLPPYMKYPGYFQNSSPPTQLHAPPLDQTDPLISPIPILISTQIY